MITKSTIYEFNADFCSNVLLPLHINNKHTFVSPLFTRSQRSKAYKSQNQTTSYATENKYCFKSFLNLSILKLMSMTVIGSEFQTLGPEDRKLRGPK